MQNSSERRISDLPPEVVLRICKYIGDNDILNAIQAIPTWNWVALSTWFRVDLSRRISQWSWIDRYIYRRLFPQQSPHLYRDPCGAFKYRLKQEEFYNAFYTDDLPMTGNIRFLVFPPSDEEIRFDFEHDETQSVDSATSLLERITEDDINETDDSPLPCDFVLFFAEMSEICKEDLQLTVDLLKPYQTLGVAVIKDVTTDRRSDFECLLDYLKFLGGLDKSPLVNALFHWRMWCVHQDGEKTVNTKEMLTWLRDTSLWRRKQHGS